MKTDHPKKVSTSLNMLRFPSPSESRVETLCLHCASPLAIHQPDVETPERLLGTCESCKHWFLIDLVREWSEGVIVWLPDSEVVRDLSNADPSAGISELSLGGDGGST
jgi:hypothetical protein